MKKAVTRWDKRLSWPLAALTVSIISLGYAMTNTSIPSSELVGVHTALAAPFAALFLFHALATTVLSNYPWRKAVQGLLMGRRDRTALLKIAHLLTGCAMLLSGSGMLYTGLVWLGYDLPPIVSFSMHRQFDDVFVVALFIHLSQSALEKMWRPKKGGAEPMPPGL